MEVKSDEVKLWLVVVTWLLLWELSALKVTLLQLLLSSDASFAERKIVEGELEWELGEKLSNPMRETKEENRGINENILAPWRSWWVLKDHVTGKKPPNPVMGNWRRKLDKKSIDKKPPNSMRNVERKLMDCVWWKKTFQPELEQKKKNRKIV